jgi:hypothetical protein
MFKGVQRTVLGVTVMTFGILENNNRRPRNRVAILSAFEILVFCFAARLKLLFQPGWVSVPTLPPVCNSHYHITYTITAKLQINTVDVSCLVSSQQNACRGPFSWRFTLSVQSWGGADKAPQPLLPAGSRAARVKVTVSGVLHSSHSLWKT